MADLIRHGKQHDKANHDHAHRARERDQQQQRTAPAQQNVTRTAQQPEKVPAKDPLLSPNYRREAELIVQEENEAKKQMPIYKGLENFKLIEKMGEYVVSLMVLTAHL